VGRSERDVSAGCCGLQVHRPGYSRLYYFKCRDGDEDLPVNGEPWGLLFDRESGFRREPEEQAKQDDLIEKIADFLVKHPHSTTNAVAKFVGAGKGRPRLRCSSPGGGVQLRARAGQGSSLGGLAR
jgi:hypothetical protein